MRASQEGSSAMYFVARTGTGGWSPGYNLTFSGSMERLTAKVKALKNPVHGLRAFPENVRGSGQPCCQWRNDSASVRGCQSAFCG